MKSKCVFLGDQIEGSDGVFNCRVFDQCSPDGLVDAKRSCVGCDKRLCDGEKDFKDRWIDPLHVTNYRIERTDSLRGFLNGRPTFLVCGGPSATPEILSQLNQRGVFSLAVNNAAGNVVRPQAFVHTDPPIKFSHSIWLDPGIMKFVPIPKLEDGRNNIRLKRNGVFHHHGHNTDCPNVWGFRRNSWMMPDDNFFTNIGASWGNQDSGVKKTGLEKTVCTMMCGMRLLYYLGSRRIYMVGVDFRMTPGAEYSFKQAKEVNADLSNNRQYRIVNDWMCKMVGDGVFGKFGLEVYNCYDRSGLRAFPYVPFTHALRDVIGHVEQEPDLEGWYEKENCPYCMSWNVKWTPTDCVCRRCKAEWDAKRRPKIKKSQRCKLDKELKLKGM